MVNHVVILTVRKQTLVEVDSIDSCLDLVVVANVPRVEGTQALHDVLGFWNLLRTESSKALTSYVTKWLNIGLVIENQEIWMSHVSALQRSTQKIELLKRRKGAEVHAVQDLVGEGLVSVFELIRCAVPKRAVLKAHFQLNLSEYSIAVSQLDITNVKLVLNNVENVDFSTVDDGMTVRLCHVHDDELDEKVVLLFEPFCTWS